MPKKKPIDKRLNKLFDDIQQVEPTSAEVKPRPKKAAKTAKKAAKKSARKGSKK